MGFVVWGQGPRLPVEALSPNRVRADVDVIDITTGKRYCDTSFWINTLSAPVWAAISATLASQSPRRQIRRSAARWIRLWPLTASVFLRRKQLLSAESSKRKTRFSFIFLFRLPRRTADLDLSCTAGWYGWSGCSHAYYKHSPACGREARLMVRCHRVLWYMLTPLNVSINAGRPVHFILWNEAAGPPRDKNWL